jgi:hypothetical protein
MSTLIVACILAIIAIFAYAIYYQISKAKCSKDTDCKPSYKCQSGKCVPPGTATSGTNDIICNSDICPLPYTCQNNKCVEPCSVINCPSPKICQNNQCITPICTPNQFAKLFPYGDTCVGQKIAGPCTATPDEKYLSFAQTSFNISSDLLKISPGLSEVVSNLSADECKNKCDLDPNCTIWNYDQPDLTRQPNRCLTIKQPIVRLLEYLHRYQGPFDCNGFFYSPIPDFGGTGKYWPPTYVKIAALE